MNIKNLQAIADLCRTIAQESFNMRNYRHQDDKTSAECGSVGCVVGHATVLETGELPRDGEGNILFTRWSEGFTGMNVDSPEWRWCFGAMWEGFDNTPEGAAKRIEYMLAGNPVKNLYFYTAEAVETYS